MKLNKGFSVLELLGALLVTSFLIIMVNNIMLKIYQSRAYNQMADQIKQSCQIAIKYITDNYRIILQQQSSVIIPFNQLVSYLPTGVKVANKFTIKPCLYIFKVPDNRLQAYLLVNNTVISTKFEIAKLAQIIGASTSTLVHVGNSYAIHGSVTNSTIQNFDAARLVSECGFVHDLPAYSLLIDLTEDNNLFTQMQSMIDQNSTADSLDPSLKKSGSLTTMQTNLYLDNILKDGTLPNSEQHAYRALDYGISKVSGARIQLRSHAAAGNTTLTSQLDINNAALQAGTILPLSHEINPGDNCASSDLGKMAQQTINNIVVSGGQLQCTYNPTFCNSGYCYLPIRSSNILYQYNVPQTIGSCPPGTIFDDSNQPADGILNQTTCPKINGAVKTQGVHAAKTNCYTSTVTGFSFCKSYQTVCSYFNVFKFRVEEALVPALVKLQCTAATATYTIDNYH